MMRILIIDFSLEGEVSVGCALYVISVVFSQL